MKNHFNCVYTINNIHTQEVLYVGSCLKLSKRITNHKYESKTNPDRKLYKYINHYGWNNFEFKVVCENIVVSTDNTHIMRILEEQFRKLYKPQLNTHHCFIENKKEHISKLIKCKYCDSMLQKWNMSRHTKYSCKKKPVIEEVIDIEIEKNHYDDDETKTPSCVDIP